MKKLLITYYTKTNTTKEISNEIAEILNTNGYETTVVPLSNATDLQSYDGIIVGGPIHGMRWCEATTKFVNQNETVLKSIPNAIFLDGYLLKIGRKIWRNAINKSLNVAGGKINTLSKGKFGGRVDTIFPGPVRLLFGVKKDAELDQRDHTLITNWANEIGELFK